MSAGSLHALDGRAGRRATSRTTKRWVVEWKGKSARDWQAQQEHRTKKKALAHLATMTSFVNLAHRVVEVVVVERRKVVEQVGACSPIGQAQRLSGEPRIN